MAEWPCCYDPLRVSLCPRIFFTFFLQVSNPDAIVRGCFFTSTGSGYVGAIERVPGPRALLCSCKNDAKC